jgi:hypothetical protein
MKKESFCPFFFVNFSVVGCICAISELSSTANYALFGFGACVGWGKNAKGSDVNGR